MNYNRYLDLHLCTSSDMAACKLKAARKQLPRECFFSKDTHFYEFTESLMQQMRYREAKDEGFTFNDQNKGNCRIISDKELTHAGGINWLRLVNGQITEEIKQIRYVGCMVAIENLKTTTVYPQLQALMRWISDPATVNKLRINSHGSGEVRGGMSMGTVQLSPDELIEALTRHGLTRPSTHFAAVQELAVGARWKLDSEKAACEKCSKKFGVFTRQHHCRRCGGLFCDAHSSKTVDLAVALTGEKRGGAVQQTATAYNVKRARVCDACYDRVASPAARALAEDRVLGEVFGESVAAAAGETGSTNYGLKTICLACCMGAKADIEFSPERENAPIGPPLANTTFVQDSLAARLLIALRARNLTGIKVTASNQVLADYGAEGIAAICGITVPSEKGSAANLRDSAEHHSFVGAGQQTMSFPAYIWGKRQSLKAKYDQLARQSDAANPLGFAGFGISDRFSDNITVVGRRLFFGESERSELGTLQQEFLVHWIFYSWAQNRAAIVAQPGGNPTGHTWALTPPPRVAQMTLVRAPAAAVGAPGGNSISITVRSEALESFKHYKSYEVS